MSLTLVQQLPSLWFSENLHTLVSASDTWATGQIPLGLLHGAAEAGRSPALDSAP